MVLKYYWSDLFNVPRYSEKSFRRNLGFQTPRVFTNFGKRTLCYSVPRFFKELPGTFYEISSGKELKKSTSRTVLISSHVELHMSSLDFNICICFPL